MKIRGRFIGILAVLGLLIALVPLASAGAVTGTVTLMGGADGKGQFFSDRTGYNIVTIQVKDADLSPARPGTARASTQTNRTIDLSVLVVAGEKSEIDNFKGGTTNGPCMMDHDDADEATDETNAYNSDCKDDGNAEWVQVANDGEITVIGPGTVPGDGDLGTLALRFKLTKIARDIQGNGKKGVGYLNEDDITLKKNGNKQILQGDATLPTGAGVFYQAVIDRDDTPGDGITHIVVHNSAGDTPARANITSSDITSTDTFTVDYKYSEFGFGNDNGKTLLTDEGTRVRYGGTATIDVDVDGDGDDDPAYTSVNSRATVASASGSQIRVNETTETGGNLTDQVVVTFYYHVRDDQKDFVTLSSASAGTVKLKGVETGADSDTFEAEVAVFSRADLAKINTAKGAVVLNDGGDKVLQINELNTTYQLNDPAVSAALGGSDELYQRVMTAAVELGLDVAADTAEALFDKLISGEDGDVISVTYTDADPSTTVGKSARVDMKPPTVELISPIDKIFTNSVAVTFEAEVTDSGAGVDESDITIVTGPTSGTSVHAPIVNGYRVTAASTGEISEGMHKWYVGVKDKVGNIPEYDDSATDKVNEAPRGAGSKDISDVTDDRLNPFVFTVDTRAPTIISARTGLYLKNPGTTSGTDTDQEDEKTSNRQWVRVLFDLGAGGAPLDPATVSANDFRVDGAEPTAVMINAKTHDDTLKTSEAKAGAAVYLQVGQLDTDARPKVELTGEVKDKADNIRTAGTVAAAADGISPVVTVTPSADIAKDEVTITVVSSERLRVNPTVKLTDAKPIKGVPVEDVAHVDPALAVSVQTGTFTTWTTTRKEARVATRYYVVVRAEDQNDNSVEVGVNAKEGDLVSFQLDGMDPMVRFVDAAGKDLKSTKQEEGAVWIVAEFDDDEHGDSGVDGETTDSYRKVEITSLKLMNKDSEEVVTEDVTMVFGAEVPCVDHDTDDANGRYVKTSTADDAPYAKNNMCAERTLAIALTPGMYNIAITGVDQTGNEVTKNTDFEVIEAKPFELILRPGQNFISIPGMPMDDGGNIDTLFSDEAISSVSTYDRSRELAGENPWLRSSKDLETGMFSGDITALEPGKAYFVNSTASVIVKVKLQAAGQLPPTIPVRQGFNAIGFWSVTGQDDAVIDLYLGSIGWSVAYSYDPTPGKGWAIIRKGETDEVTGDGLTIEAGKGYLVYALYDAVLTP